MCGAATIMPSVLGRKSRSSPLCGFSHTMRWHSRARRSIAVASTSGSPRSSPSEQITTIPPRHRPRRPQSRTNASSDCADPGAALPVDHGPRRLVERRVGRLVLQLPGDPGQPGAEAEHLDPRGRRAGPSARTAAGARVVGHRAGHVEDQDQRPQLALALAGRTAPDGSPCMRIDSLIVARRSGSVPRPLAGLVRRVRRRGGVSRILVMIRRSAASSSGVHAANDRCLSASTSDAIQPRRRPLLWSSSRARLGGGHHERRLGLERRLGGCEHEHGSWPARPRRGSTRGTPGRRRRSSSCRLTRVALPGPVQVDQVGRVERRHGGEVGEHVAGADRQPGGPQLVGEPDQDVRERVVHRGVSHRR